jgi:hypothetical protein
VTPTAESAQPATWAALHDAIWAAQPGMYVTSMETLRNLTNIKRTDKALPEIEEMLKQRAVGWLPDPLPVRSNAKVALFLRNTETGDFAWAISMAAKGVQLTPTAAQVLETFGSGFADEEALDQLQQKMLALKATAEDVAKFADGIQPPRRRRR